MLPYISHVTNENAAKYDLDIYVKGSYEEKRVDEIVITHKNEVLCKVFMDDEISFLKTYDDRIDLSAIDFEVTSNKKIRNLCRIIGTAIGTATDE